MSAVDLPTPLVVTRHQCPHCRRYTRASLTRVQQHMAACWKNPAARTCKTCVYHQEESIDPGHYCHPGMRCRCNDWDEACTHPEGPEDYTFPVTGCPLWEPDARTRATT
ncbi:hypothetical protein ACUN3E_38105 [Streptomyces sp. Ju416(a)]|uniref:hypothetical protein n=1 Tax=Streptomyces sp. Ju416(a) TaxID=3446591 RepID=UPI00403DACDD